MDIARGMFREYQEGLGIDLCFQSFDEELNQLPGKYAPPRGALLLFESEGEFVACGALRDLGDGICELKRIYVRPAARRGGLGRRLSEMLIRRARDLGYSAVRLDTLRRLDAAVRLYRSLGFAEIEPYTLHQGHDIVYMELRLAQPRALPLTRPIAVQ